MMPASPFNDTTAETFDQLGGWEFARLIGTKAISSDDSTLKVRFTGKAKYQINLIYVTLMGDDTYTMEFMRASGESVVSVLEFEGVYWDQLQDIFESSTGLFTSLFPRN